MVVRIESRIWDGSRFARGISTYRGGAEVGQSSKPLLWDSNETVFVKTEDCGSFNGDSRWVEENMRIEMWSWSWSPTDSWYTCEAMDNSWK